MNPKRRLRFKDPDWMKVKPSTEEDTDTTIICSDIR